MIIEVIWGGTSVQGPFVRVMENDEEVDPVILGDVDITLIEYVPEVRPPGIEKLIELEILVPTELVLSKEPISVGEEKLPEEFDNWTMNSFPGLNVPVEVKSTLPVCPVSHEIEKGGVNNVLVVIVFETEQEPERVISSILNWGVVEVLVHLNLKFAW
jgi:hypothetical protein